MDVTGLKCADLVDAMGRLHRDHCHILDLVSPTPGRILFGPAVTISYFPSCSAGLDPEQRLSRDTERAMSQENVELAARWYEVATSKAELLAAMPRTMAFCHPEVEWTGPEDVTTYHGREGVRRRLEQWLESFEDYRYEVQRIVDCGGDQVLVVANEVARGAVSGADVRSTQYELLTIRDGMIVRIREFYDEGDALDAAGLQE
jgi:ketosteroid isomerase-like protein